MSNSKSNSKSKSEAERFQLSLFKRLFIASFHGDLKLVKESISAGADVNRGRPEDGATPLIAASSYGHLAVVRLFVESNAYINIATNDIVLLLCVLPVYQSR